ncbi:MAG: YXWGXW repeat-containing protein [Thermoguttaceae bacterium]|jgi:hypothetical protein
MKAYLMRGSILVGVLGVAWGASVALGQEAPPPPPEPGAAGGAAGSGMDVLTRGPIHEAFAQPVNTGNVQPMVVPQKPPDPIEELPPDAKPEDPRATWISGYWSWADDRKDFLWVSGVWRVPPPTTQWVAGYWNAAPGGYQWTAGFWSPAAQQQVTYYPPPPASQELGPTSALPGANYFWIPGSWVWQGDRYAWRPGYWAPAREGWVWVPASYYSSPAGWVYCNGYWDYPLATRGVMFAPVYFTPDYYRRPGFVYSPGVVIDSGLLTFGLFVRPNYGHYYYGDYYGVEYDHLGIYPWFGVNRYHAYAYDPLFTYYGCYYRERDPHWVAHLEGWHEYYRGHPDLRPPHTLAAQMRLNVEFGNRPDRAFLTVGVNLDTYRRNPHGPVRLVEVSPAERARLHEEVHASREIQSRRFETEARSGHAGMTGPRQLSVARAPLAAAAGHPGEHGAGALAPGHREEAFAPHPEAKLAPHPEAKTVPPRAAPTKLVPGKPAPGKAKPDRERG